jgi:hypothetical protein
MHKIMLLGICFLLLVFSSIAFADECSKDCQTLGDAYYDICMEYLNRGEAPPEIITFDSKFIVPEKGYPRNQYCYSYAVRFSYDCFEECPPMITLFGPIDPRYTRNHIVKPAD